MDWLEPPKQDNEAIDTFYIVTLGAMITMLLCYLYM